MLERVIAVRDGRVVETSDRRLQISMTMTYCIGRSLLSVARAARPWLVVLGKRRTYPSGISPSAATLQ